jgi:hypothetical protein
MAFAHTERTVPRTASTNSILRMTRRYTGGRSKPAVSPGGVVLLFQIECPRGSGRPSGSSSGCAEARSLRGEPFRTLDSSTNTSVGLSALRFCRLHRALRVVRRAPCHAHLRARDQSKSYRARCSDHCCRRSYARNKPALERGCEGRDEMRMTAAVSAASFTLLAAIGVRERGRAAIRDGTLKSSKASH